MAQGTEFNSEYHTHTHTHTHTKYLPSKHQARKKNEKEKD
jgi:hypothetical protein